MITDIIIPAWNEEGTIARVIEAIPKTHVRQVIVVNNRSTDRTAEAATAAGAIVLNEDKRGYGAACLKGIAFANSTLPPPDVIAFVDGDFSDHPEQLPELLAPIARGEADMVIGSRATGQREPGSMTPQQIFGNWLAVFLMRMIYGHRYTDLGPFRTIRTRALNQLGMVDQTYGWTVEMQVKALKHKLKVTEVPMRYRKRGAGKSKVAGTVKGTILAGYKIITTIFKYI